MLADLTLVAYILILIPAMLIGLSYARRGKHRPQHRNVMWFITIANWLLIAFLMFAAYRFDIADNITRQPTNLRYLLPTIHGLLGLPAQILATFILVRMFIEDRTVAAAKRRGETQFKPYFWKWAKPIMQTTLALWLATALLGIASYVIRYNVISTPLAPGGAAPGNVETVVTPEVVATPEVMMTDEVASNPEVEPTAGPSPTRRPTIAFSFGAAAATTEATEAIAVTPEVTEDSTPGWMRFMTPEIVVTPEVSATAEVGMVPFGWLVFAPRIVRTPEAVDAPSVATTPEVMQTPEIAATAEVVSTPEVVETPEVADDDDSGRGRGRGRGRGGDDNDSGDDNGDDNDSGDDSSG